MFGNLKKKTIVKINNLFLNLFNNKIINKLCSQSYDETKYAITTRKTIKAPQPENNGSPLFCHYLFLLPYAFVLSQISTRTRAPVQIRIFNFFQIQIIITSHHYHHYHYILHLFSNIYFQEADTPSFVI